MPGFHFLIAFLHHLVLANLATSCIRVNLSTPRGCTHALKGKVWQCIDTIIKQYCENV